MFAFILKILPIISALSGLLVCGVLYAPGDQVNLLFAETDGQSATWIITLVAGIVGVVVQQFFPQFVPLWEKLRGLFATGSDDDGLAQAFAHLTAVQTYGVGIGCEKLVKGACDLSQHCAELAIRRQGGNTDA